MTTRIEFKDVLGLNKKTVTQDVVCNRIFLGQIKFYPHWRRYCFFPEKDTLYDSFCLREIYLQAEKLMQERIESQDYIKRHSGLRPL